jgi:hypothetical protein
MLSELMEVREWNSKSDKVALINELSDNYFQSITTQKKSQTGRMLKLESGMYICRAPYGLEKINKEGLPKTYKGQPTCLKQKDTFQFIKKAFGMKVE